MAWRVSPRISIHTLRMEGDGLYLYEDIRIEISIHTLRMEGDFKLPQYLNFFIGISIHTLRMEGDLCFAASKGVYNDFNPHPPRGG